MVWILAETDIQVWAIVTKSPLAWDECQEPIGGQRRWQDQGPMAHFMWNTRGLSCDSGPWICEAVQGVYVKHPYLSYGDFQRDTSKEEHWKASYFLFVVEAINLADLGKVMKGACPRPTSWRDFSDVKDTDSPRIKTSVRHFLSVRLCVKHFVWMSPSVHKNSRGDVLLF